MQIHQNRHKMKAILKYDHVLEKGELDAVTNNVTAIPRRTVYTLPNDPKSLVIEIEKMMGTIDKLSTALSELEEWLKANCNDPKTICIIV